MALLKVGTENSTDIEIYYEDHGAGKPVVLVHGWPLNGASWEKQTAALLEAGYRVITYDRRGFGKSSQPASGYEYDTLAADLDVLIRHLDLKDASLFGFSMGGGEVARYLGRHNGEGRVTKAGFLGSVAPALGKTAENPDGVPKEVFEGIKEAIRKDRAAQLAEFLKLFYNVAELKGKRVSEEAVQASWNVGIASSAAGYLACVHAWQTDLRADLKNVTIPILAIHGAKDQIVPLAFSAERLVKIVPSAELHVYDDGPHGFLLTHADETNKILLEFLSK